ncbi:hypothetical protein WJX82_010597 [Trebouxia sp. C0006]
MLKPARKALTEDEAVSGETERLIKTTGHLPHSKAIETNAVDQKVVLAKLNSHLLWKFFALTVLCYIDRTNLAFAAIQLNKSLGFTEHIYGVGASIFFVGYSICQIPSNLILVRVGAPLWLSVLIVSWGIVATAFAAINGKWMFYILRLLLGATESGTFPGMWYHLSTFYTDKEIGVAYSYVSAGTALSQVIGAPLAAGLLALDGWLGLAGWQWLFIVEGIPTVLMGLYTKVNLAESPAKASFLTPAEKTWLQQRHAESKASKTMAGVEVSAWGAVRNWRTWYLALINLCDSTVKYAIIYWCPLIIYHMVGENMPHATGEAVVPHDAVVALLTALPFGFAAVFMLVNARHSAATGERRWHVTIPLAISSLALASMSHTMAHSPFLAFMSLLAATLAWAPNGIMYSYPATFLQGAAAATGVALINSIANIGGMIGPYLIGTFKHSKGDYSTAIMVLAGLSAFTCVLTANFKEPSDAKHDSQVSRKAHDIVV